MTDISDLGKSKYIIKCFVVKDEILKKELSVFVSTGKGKALPGV